jgi:hypothetical protein
MRREYRVQTLEQSLRDAFGLGELEACLFCILMQERDTQ